MSKHMISSWSRRVIAGAALLMLAGCFPTLSEPPPRTAAMPEATFLYGAFISAPDSESDEFMIVIANQADDSGALEIRLYSFEPAQIGKLEIYEGIPITIAGINYLSLRQTNEDLHGWYLTKVDSNETSLTLAFMDAEAAAEIVQSGALAGTLERGAGEVEVHFTASGAEVAAFLARPEAQALFPSTGSDKRSGILFFRRLSAVDALPH